MNMHRSFAEWYRTVDVDPQDVRLQKRWQGIEGYCKNDIGSHDVLELTRLFFQKPVGVEFRKSFVNAFYEIDNAFPEKNNLELSVLAGATIVYALENYDKIDNLAVLAMLSASFNKRSITVPSILTEIKDTFVCMTAKIRESMEDNFNFQSSVPSHKKMIEKFNAAKENPALWSATEIGEGFSAYAIALNKHLTEIRKFAQESLLKQSILQEDSQILWWMTGEFSRDMQKPFRSFKPSEVCVIIGKELADLVKILPGPYASNAVLYKVLSVFPENETENITFSTAINKLGKIWRQRTIEAYPAKITKEITPLLSAISGSLDVDGATEWKPAYKKLTGFDASNIKMSASKLAYQMYLECLVIKSMKDCEEG